MHAPKEPRRPAIEPILNPINVAAARLGLSRSFLYEQVKRGRLRLLKIGNRSLVHEAELRRFADELAADTTARAA